MHLRLKGQLEIFFIVLSSGLVYFTHDFPVPCLSKKISRGIGGVVVEVSYGHMSGSLVEFSMVAMGDCL